MQQGTEINPHALSTRVVGSVWWIFALIIISSYTANLAAFLTVNKPDVQLEKVQDLLVKTQIQPGLIGSGSTEAFFRVLLFTLFCDQRSSRPDLNQQFNLL